MSIRRISAVPALERVEIAREYLAGDTVQMIGSKHGISSVLARRIARAEGVEEIKASIERMRRDELELARARGEIKALAVLEKDAAFQAKKKSVKDMMRDVFNDLVVMWDSNKHKTTFVPRSPEGLANALQKVADTYARISDEGDIAPDIIQIQITGSLTEAEKAAAIDTSIIDTPMIPEKAAEETPAATAE